MPRRLRYQPFVQLFFERNQLHWEAPVTELKYVKDTMGAQLAAYGVTRLVDVVLISTECASLQEVAELYAQLLVSPRLQECAGNDGYLPRAFNRMAFNALADILDYAVSVRNTVFGNQPAVRNRLNAFRHEYPELEPNSIRRFLVDEFNENQQQNIGRNPLVRAQRTCPCRSSANTCNASPACRWMAARNGKPPGCVARALVDNPDQARRRAGPKEYYAENDAGVLAAEALFGPFVDAGEAGRFRRINPRHGRQRNATGAARRGAARKK